MGQPGKGKRGENKSFSTLRSDIHQRHRDTSPGKRQRGDKGGRGEEEKEMGGKDQ